MTSARFVGLRLRNGYTTGACAAAGAAAAIKLLFGEASPEIIELTAGDGSTIRIPISSTVISGVTATATVRKYSGDDPDITAGMDVLTTLRLVDGDGIVFKAGEGVGIVTRPGLQVGVGEPAINPGPRRMIEEAIRSRTSRGVEVTVSIPGGEAVAKKTFNPKLGVEGGLSILGTTGILRPYSHEAVRQSLLAFLDVAVGAGVTSVAMVPGNIGRDALLKNFRIEDSQVVEVGNEWGFMLDAAVERRFSSFLVAGHPGKLVKLINGDWDTHSSRSASALPFVVERIKALFGENRSESETVQGVIEDLSDEEREILGRDLALSVAGAVSSRLGDGARVAVSLLMMDGSILGSYGLGEYWSLV